MGHFFLHFSLTAAEILSALSGGSGACSGSLDPRCSVGLDLHLPGFLLREKFYPFCSEQVSVPAGESVKSEKAEKGENNYSGLKTTQLG